MTTMDQYAKAVVEWHDREWPSPDGTPAETSRVAMKMTEEVGELCGALVKHLQGRVDEPWLDEARKEFGDVIITLCVLADRIDQLHYEQARTRDGQWIRPRGTVTFQSMFGARWARVSQRRGATYREDQS